MGRVAVLGSFDTWSYMDFISKIVARNGWIAYTSRYIYHRDPWTGQILRVWHSHKPGQLMIVFLRDELIARSDKAIIVYSVPAGHYNEAHWCAELGKRTLGLAFVRDVEESIPSPCGARRVDDSGEFSACRGNDVKASWTAWDCVRAGSCPFKKQGISLNQVEYFQIHHAKMWLLAIERLECVDRIITSFLNNTLSLPP